MEAVALGTCLEYEPCDTIARCFCLSKDRCEAKGYRASCGQMEEPGPCGEALTQAIDLDECPE